MTRSYITQYIHFVLLLSIVLSSCTEASQPAKNKTASATLEVSHRQVTFSLDRSALAYGMFDTGAAFLFLNVSSSMPKPADISVEDQAGIKTYKVDPGESVIVHSMSPGKKRVTVTSGVRSKVRGEIVGVFINKVTFSGAAIPVNREGKRVVVYGDSISVGGNVDNPSVEAWPVLLRKHFPVIVDAHGYRTLYEDAATAETRLELASKISSGRPDHIWLAIGSNDYALEVWSARDFGEAYAATLDAIHAATSEALVFAQSPILRVDESPNSFGDDLKEYRRQIAAACLARSTWCVFVDGTDPAFPQPNELDQDGVHLTVNSSTKYAKAVLDIIGK